MQAVDGDLAQLASWFNDNNIVLLSRPSQHDEDKIAKYAYQRMTDRKSTRLNSSHRSLSRMPSSA